MTKFEHVPKKEILDTNSDTCDTLSRTKNFKHVLKNRFLSHVFLRKNKQRSNRLPLHQGPSVFTASSS